MPDIHNTTTQEVRLSVNIVPPFDAAPWRVIDRAEADQILAIPQKYREWTGSVVVEMDAGEKAAVDQAILDAERDSAAGIFDEAEAVERAFALAVLDELNLHAARLNALKAAIANASNLNDAKTAAAAIVDIPDRTIAQMKTAVRAHLGT